MPSTCRAPLNCNPDLLLPHAGPITSRSPTRERSMTSVLLLENIHDTAVARFGESKLEVERRAGALAGGELLSALQAHDLVGIRSATHLGHGESEAARHLLAIGCFCIGTPQVDLNHAAHAGIPVFT